MSASREKKIRQDLAAKGITDPKAIREAEEKDQQHRSNMLYGGIAVVFVLVAAFLLLWNSNVRSAAHRRDGRRREVQRRRGRLLLL